MHTSTELCACVDRRALLERNKESAVVIVWQFCSPNGKSGRPRPFSIAPGEYLQFEARLGAQ